MSDHTNATTISDNPGKKKAKRTLFERLRQSSCIMAVAFGLHFLGPGYALAQDRKSYTALEDSITSSSLPTTQKEEIAKKKTVIVCFDGSKSIAKWNDTMKFADELSDITGQPVHFTYYINTAYLHTSMPGSEIGAGGSKQDIETRMQLMQKAIDKGHEIGGHTARHHDGSKWTEAQWENELSDFDKDVASKFHDKYGNPYKAAGFRAPYLGWNDNMYVALHKDGYKYDVSPVRDNDQVKHGIAVKGVPIYDRDRGVELGMDYNWYTSHISSSEFERMLTREAKKDKPLIISLHFANYGDKNRTYLTVVKDFLKKGAKDGKFQFMSMEEYMQNSGKIQ